MKCRDHLGNLGAAAENLYASISLKTYAIV